LRACGWCRAIDDAVLEIAQQLAHALLLLEVELVADGVGPDGLHRAADLDAGGEDLREVRPPRAAREPDK
jgi:hypothetical protein